MLAAMAFIDISLSEFGGIGICKFTRFVFAALSFASATIAFRGGHTNAFATVL